MTSLKTTFVILLSCWGLIVKCRAGDIVTDFLYTLNGDYTNIGTFNKGIGNYDSVEVTCKPVSVPGLQKKPMLYMEEAVNGTMYRMMVGNVTTDADGDIITINNYIFTKPSEHKPRDFNTDELANLPKEAFTKQEGCDCEFKKVIPGEFTGTWSDCRHVYNGQHPSYTVTVTCTEMYATIAVESFETTTKVPIIYKFKGTRYPLPGAPEDFVGPCKNGQ